MNEHTRHCNDIPCRDCENTECTLHGDARADCPKYRCTRPIEALLDCDHCAFIDWFIDEVYYKKSGKANPKPRTTY